MGNTTKEKLQEKLNYLGLNFNNIPEQLTEFVPFKFNMSRINNYKDSRVFRFIPIDEIDILITPTAKKDSLKTKYSKALPLKEYIYPKRNSEDSKNYNIFLKMLDNVEIDEIEDIANIQKQIETNKPRNGRFKNDTMWEIYYAEATQRYFMIVCSKEKNFAEFFYLLKQKIQFINSGSSCAPNIYVPVTGIGNIEKSKNFSNDFKNITNISNEEELEFENKEEELKIIENYNMNYLNDLRHKILSENRQIAKVDPGRVKIKVDEKNQTVFITLPVNRFTIALEKDEYKVYANKSKSYIIADQPHLKVMYKKLYVYIEKHQDTYFVVTNQNIQFSEKTNGLTKEKDVISFFADNLEEILLDNEILKLKCNDQYENALLKDNRTLLISEEKGKVYLPYLEEDLREAQKTYSDLSISEIIEKKYVNPIRIYKNSMISRFREAFNLMYNKENKSFKDSILLGFELMFEFNLHPAIISACRNLQELDIYLDCLDDNELEKFSCFKIIYKAMPLVTKNRQRFRNIIDINIREILIKTKVFL